MREERRMRRKILSFAVLMLILVGASTGCTSNAAAASSWPGYAVSDGMGYFSYGTQVYALDLKNGGLVWNYPNEASSGRQFYAAPAIGDEFVVVGDYENSLAALDKQSGSEKWQFGSAKDRFVGSALVLNGYVYAPNSDHYLYALDENGDLMWQFKAEGPNWTQPLADDDNLYLVSMDHFLYTLNFEYASSNLETSESGSRTLVAEPLWSLELGAAVVADPVLVDGVMYIGTIDGTLFAVDMAAKKIIWTFDADGEMASIWSSPVVLSDAVFVGDQNGIVYALSTADGSELWPTPYAAGESIVSGGVVVDDSVVYATREGKVFSISLEKELRTLAVFETELYSSLKVDGEKIIIAPAAKEGLFKAVDTNGVEIWNYIPAD